MLFGFNYHVFLKLLNLLLYLLRTILVKLLVILLLRSYLLVITHCKHWDIVGNKAGRVLPLMKHMFFGGNQIIDK